MKKWMLITGLLVLHQTTKAQQTPPSPEERLKHTSEVIQKEVNPAADQLKKIEAVYKTFFEAMDKVKKENPPPPPLPPPPPPPPAVKEQMDKLVKERDEAVKKILTEDQFKKYMEAQKKMHPPKPGQQNPPPPPHS